MGGSVVSTRLCLGYSMEVVWRHCFKCLCKTYLFIVYFCILEFGIVVRMHLVSRGFSIGEKGCRIVGGGGGGWLVP